MKLAVVVGLCCCLSYLEFSMANDSSIKKINSNLSANDQDVSLYSGFDQQGNFYRGNKKTGFYFNYGTGETCFGKFQQRKCYYKNSSRN